MAQTNTLNPMPQDFLPTLLGSFSSPAADNPTMAIMEAAFAHHRMHYRYINTEVTPANLPAAVFGAKAMGWRGFNCSLPHKVSVIPLLDSLAESARIIGAVNTVIIEKDGSLRGENTDGKGFVKAIAGAVAIPGKQVVLFGAGGAARAIGVEMALAGATRITIVNRSERGRELADLLNAQTPAEADFAPWDGEYEIPAVTDIVINATSVGLAPHGNRRLPIVADSLQAHMVAADCIPNPAYTAFLKEAKAHGCKVLPGMEMLVNQAVIALKLWTGRDVDEKVMLAKLKEVLGL